VLEQLLLVLMGGPVMIALGMGAGALGRRLVGAKRMEPLPVPSLPPEPVQRAANPERARSGPARAHGRRSHWPSTARGRRTRVVGPDRA
jgi:hypothetical protein